MSTGHLSIIIMAFTVVAYVLNKWPIPLVAMLSAAAMVAFGILPANMAWAAFSQDTVLVIAGFLLIGSTFFSTGVAKMIGDGLFKISGGRPKLSIFLMLVVASAMSPLLSNVAITMMFAPLIISVIIDANDKNIYEQKYMQMLCVGVCCTGLLTLIGSPVNIAASGLIQAAGYPPLDFFQMADIGVILFGVSLLYTYTIGDKLSDKIFKNRESSDLVKSFISEKAAIEKKLNEEKADPVKLKKANQKKRLVVIIMALCVGMIITNNLHGISMGTISLMGGIACVLTGCIPYKEMYQKIDWGTLLMIAGTIGCAAGLGHSGGGRIIATFALGLLGDLATPMAIFLVLSILSGVMTQFISNAGTIGILIPIGIAMAEQVGMNYMPVALGVTLCASMSYCTPVGTPTQASVLNWGSYKFSDYVKYSGPINIILIIVILLYIPIRYPLVG
jgi:anion transporter